MPRKGDCASLEDRFWAKVNIFGNSKKCWEWTGAIGSWGYGNIAIETRRTGQSRRTESAHRVSYILTWGSIPDGMLILHSCDNPRCVNPTHLRAGTHADNTADKMQRGRHRNGKGKVKSTCRRGHPRTSEHAVLRPTGTWTCKTCLHEAYLRRKLKNSGAA